MPGSRTQASPANTSKSIGQDILDGLRYWLPKLADPATSPIAQATAPLQAVITPGLIPASYALDKLMQTRFGKEAVAALDALPPGENLADDGLRAMASIGPLTVAQLNRVNRMRQGPTAKPTDYFHSKVADAVANWAKGFKDPSKPVSPNVFEQLYNKLKNSGFNKRELEHFTYLSNGVTIDPRDELMRVEEPDVYNNLIKTPQAFNEFIQGVNPQITVQENSRLAEDQLYKQTGLHSNTYAPRYSQITSPFSPENYREFLIRNSQQMSDAPTGHWGDPTVAAHLRVHDINNPELGRILFADEIQSDVAQKDPANATLLNYEDLAAKFLYRRAADEGYDAIALNTPAVQIARNLGNKRQGSLLRDLIYETRGEFLPPDIPGITPQIVKAHANVVTLEKDLRQLYAGRSIINLDPNHEDLIRTAQEEHTKARRKLNSLVDELGEQREPPTQTRFQGFLDFYGKNLPKAMSKHLKNMGLAPEEAAGKEVSGLFTSEVNALPPTTTFGAADMLRQHNAGLLRVHPEVLEAAQNYIRNPRSFTRLAFEDSFNKYRPPSTTVDHPDKQYLNYRMDHPTSSGYIHPPFTQPLVYPIKPEHKSGGLSGHTDSFWSMLSALGLGGLAEMTKRKLANQQQE